MAKAIRERDSKAILYNYLNQLLAQETRKGFQLPSLKSVTVGANTDLEELTLKQPWLEKQVQIIVEYNLLILCLVFSSKNRSIDQKTRKTRFDWG